MDFFADGCAGLNAHFTFRCRDRRNTQYQMFSWFGTVLVAVCVRLIDYTTVIEKVNVKTLTPIRVRY